VEKLIRLLKDLKSDFAQVSSEQVVPRCQKTPPVLLMISWDDRV
jgi:hypothetical protein